MFLLVSWIYLLVSCACVDAEKDCIRFHVPRFEGFTVAENTRKTISFSVTDQCQTQHGFEFDVKRGTATKMARICGIKTLYFLKHGPCSCIEDGRNLSCNLTETFDRRKTKWTFESGAIEAMEKEKVQAETFYVNVTYDTVITSFYLAGASDKTVLEVDERQKVSARCEWERGNPPRDVSIRTNMDNVATKRHGEGQSYLSPQVIQSAKCEDTGQYRCQVDGTNQSKTATLLVKCPPQFLGFNGANRTSQVSYGADEDLNFSIFSYKNITNCTLKSHQNEQLLECRSNRSEYVVSGTLPDWNLTLTIKDVSEEDNGTWQLSVGNGFKGVAAVNFTLDVKLRQQDKGIEMWQILMIISIVVAVAALGLCIFITVRVYRSRKSKGKKVSSPNGQTFGSREPLAEHNPKEDCGMIVNELYSSSEPQGESIMITNDIYEGSGDTRTSTAPAPASGYEEVKIDAGNGTVAMVTTKTAGNNAGVYVNTAEADAQRKKEEEKNKKRPKERAPGPPASGMGEAKKNKKDSNKKTEKEASPSKSKAQTNTADAKTTNTAEKPAKGRNSDKKEAKPNSTEKTATTGNPTNDENKKANADASKTKSDAAKTKSDPAKTKTDASKSKPDQAKHDAPGAKADAADTNANARTKTDATEGAASNDDQGSILVDARVPNAEGCLYGQLDFSRVKPRTTIIKDLPSTDYAEINFKAPPPPPPAPED